MKYADDFVPAQRAIAEPYGFDCYESALRSWIATVAIVEVGYVGEWEEYTHELMARGPAGGNTGAPRHWRRSATAELERLRPSEDT
jgi:hypothetical protein